MNPTNPTSPDPNNPGPNNPTQPDLSSAVNPPSPPPATPPPPSFEGTSASPQPTPPQPEMIPPPENISPPIYQPPIETPSVTEPPLSSDPSNFNWSLSPAQTPDLSTQPVPENPLPPQPVEQAPTDLSHLVDETAGVYTPPVTQPETLVVPTNGSTPDVPNIPNQGEGGIPKWVIGVGAGLLLAVIGASTYFILGIGRGEEQTTSLPATTTQQLSAPPASAPTPTTQSSPAGFGTFDETKTQATSAADLLRQRQGR